jgi:pyruvate formate lyase activating enzyme
MKEALLWKKEGGKIRCLLCNHKCLILQGKRGVCAVRQNQDQKLYALTYGKLIATHVDPVEKKPLYHFYPGHGTFSIASVGCNFSCRFCQNADIAQLPRDFGGQITGDDYLPDDVIGQAIKTQSMSISYTYTEPTVGYEFTKDCGNLAKKEGLKNIYVTNGYMSEEMLKDQKFIDAANVDLKAFSDNFYREICGGSLEPVLETLKLMKKKKIWLEITTLVIPGKNDSDSELKSAAEFIAGELGSEVPWHLSAFHPDYKMSDIPPTSQDTLMRAYDIGQEAGLDHIYIGNIDSPLGRDTICPKCGETLISRRWFEIYENRPSGGKCPNCAKKISGYF